MRADARRRLAFAVLLLLPMVWADDLSRFAIARLAAFALAATGVSVVSGLCGQISLGHAALMAAGGFTSAGLVLHAGWPFVASFPAGIAVAVAVGAGLGVPSLRLRGQYLALATLAGGFIVFQVVRQDPGMWTGGDLGVGNIPPPSFGGGESGPLGVALLAVAALGTGLFFAGNLAASRAGRAFRAVRDGEAAAEACGISVYRVKLGAFLVSAAMAGAAGAVLAHSDGFVAAGDFDPRASLGLVLAVVLGGFSSPYGGALGTLAILGPIELAPRAFAWLDDFQLIAWGPVALLVVFRWPDGIAGMLRALARRLRAAPAPPVLPAEALAGAAGAAVLAGAPASDGIALQARGITKRYGGLTALERVDLAVRAGTIHALIGPNGSGKTTLLDAIGGFARHEAGTVAFLGHEATRLPPHRIARLGVARTFQAVSVFEGMTALDNVLVGAHASLRGGPVACGLGLGGGAGAAAARAHELLRALGLAGYAGTKASALSYGQRKRLELARAFAGRPRVLVLDEPAAGRGEVEIIELGRLLLRLRTEGLTTVLVEHHMNFVLSIADTVTVLDEGRVVAEGPPAAVRADPAVIAAYLGDEVA